MNSETAKLRTILKVTKKPQTIPNSIKKAGKLQFFVIHALTLLASVVLCLCPIIFIIFRYHQRNYSTITNGSDFSRDIDIKEFLF